MTLSDPQPIDLFAEIRKLNFPAGHFLVAGSAIMAAKGIRPAYDLDIIVTQELFDICKASGWELKPWTRTGKVGKPWLQKGIADLMLELGFDEEVMTATDLMKEGEIIDGIHFLSLEQLMKYKREYGRPKDFEDIALIENFLKK